MRRGRYLAMCTACFMTGNFIGAYLTLAPEIYLLLAVCASAVSLFYRNNYSFAIAMILLGSSSVQIGRIPVIEDVTLIQSFSLDLKMRFSRYLETILPPGDELSIVKALAIGDKSSVSREVLADYKASGAVHLLALSGLHVGVIYKLFALALKPLGGYPAMKRLRTVIVLCSMWLFAIVSGLGSSISRAVIMITFYELSPYFHSDRDGLSVLSASALFIMLRHPEAPREIGFQFSFAAMLSIYIIYPRLKALLDSRIGILRWMWNTIAVSISCQMTTGVISYFYFGTFPIFFMITNLVTMPLITIIMYLIPLSVLSVKTPFGPLFSVILCKSVALMNKIMSIIGGL